MGSHSLIHAGPHTSTPRDLKTAPATASHLTTPMGNKESRASPSPQRTQHEQLLVVLQRTPSQSELQELFARGRVSGINATSTGGKTPLTSVISSHGDPAIVKLLLENGADVNGRDRAKKTPLHHASSAETVALLVAHGAQVNALDENGNPPLFDAVGLGELQVVEALVVAGASVTSVNSSGESAVFAVTLRTSVLVLKMLIDRGAPVNVFSKSLDTPMHTAANASVDIVQFMLDHGVPIDAVSSLHGTPLNVAVSQGRREIVDFLLKKGANVHGDKRFRVTPLRQAVENGRLDIMDMLVTHGASFDPQAAAREASRVAASERASPAARSVAMVDLMTKHCSAIQPNKPILAAWMEKLKELLPMMHDATSVCEGLCGHIDVIVSNTKYGDLEDTPRSHLALALVVLRIWKWMLEYKETSVAQRILRSTHWLEEITALHEAIYAFDVRFQTNNGTRHARPYSGWEDRLRRDWSVRLHAKREAAREMRHFLAAELKRCSAGGLQAQAFWGAMYLFAFGVKMLRDQELHFGELINCKCTDPAVTPPECRADKTPPSCASDVYLIGRCIVNTLTGGKPWTSVSRDVARVLLGAGRLPPKPQVASDEQWQLVGEMCVVDPVKRADMAHVVEKLREFAQEKLEP